MKEYMHGCMSGRMDGWMNVSECGVRLLPGVFRVAACIILGKVATFIVLPHHHLPQPATTTHHHVRDVVCPHGASVDAADDHSNGGGVGHRAHLLPVGRPGQVCDRDWKFQRGTVVPNWRRTLSHPLSASSVRWSGGECSFALARLLSCLAVAHFHPPPVHTRTRTPILFLGTHPSSLPLIPGHGPAEPCQLRKRGRCRIH